MFSAGYTQKNTLPKRSVRSRTISDYSPFGVLLPERSVNAGDFRYGFQGQERDDEVKGEGNSIVFEFRNYDPRIGRMCSVDPLTDKYPFYSPYAFSGNRVLDAIEFEGLEPVVLNNELVGYRVLSGQGPIAIAEDINNPETKKKYGYCLFSRVTYLDIVSSNLSDFKNVKDLLNINDPGYRKLEIKKGDILSLGAVSKKEKQIEEYNERILLRIKRNNKRISEIKKEDSGPIITEKEIKEQEDAISDAYDGEPTRTGEAFAHIAVRSIANKVNSEYYRKEANKTLRIDKLLEENNTLKKQLKTKQ